MSRIVSVLALLAVLALPALAIDFSPLDTIPVQEGGRKKPYLVFAEESLLSLSGKTALALDGRRQSATEIITGIWLDPDPRKWNEQPLILIANLPLKEALGLPRDRKLFSLSELAANSRLPAMLRAAEQTPAERRDASAKAVLQVGERLQLYDALLGGGTIRVVASRGPAWEAIPAGDADLAALRAALAAGDDGAFASAASKLRSRLAAIEPALQPPDWKIRLETLYQKAHPFRWAWILYLAAGITLAVTSLRQRRAGYVIGWTLAAAGALLQIAGFVCRILVAGRPPVSNMYESVIWVAFGAVLFALIFEAIYRGRYFLLGASFAAVVPLILADTQPLALDRSIQPLVPVLQSNFWLSTHVLVITLSYAAFLLALGVAHIALGAVIFGRKPSQALYNYIYRSLQVGVLLLATGTILGAVWANYSWGRFWDWDPKETWALAALLVYLVVLHGRIAGVWGGFGLSVGAVLAYQSIVMAWYGVNFVLGVGLHSYGFGSGGFGYAAIFVAIELSFTAVAILRHRQPSQPAIA